MNGKTQLEVVGAFGTIHIKDVLDYDYLDKIYLYVKVGDNGTYLGCIHEYVFKEWYYIRIMEK